MTRAMVWTCVALFAAGCSNHKSSPEAETFEAARGDLANKLDDLMTAIDDSPGGLMGPVADDPEKSREAGVKLAAQSHRVIVAARKISRIHADGDLATCVANTMDAVGAFEKHLGPIARQYESDPQDASLTGTLQDDGFRRTACSFLKDEACKAAFHTTYSMNPACR